MGPWTITELLITLHDFAKYHLHGKYTQAQKKRYSKMNFSWSSMWKPCTSRLAQKQRSLNIMQMLDYNQNMISLQSLPTNCYYYCYFK